MDDLRQQFEELLTALRDFQLLPEHHNGSEEDKKTEHERQRLQKKAELAMETFRTSFGERLNDMPGILSSTPFQDAIAKMMEWASQLLPDRAERTTFSTIEECSSWLKHVTSLTASCLPNGDVRTCWPFIQKVQVYLNAYILSKGLIISDLPGLRDLNSARQAITERYVRQCHQIFIVAKIDRAITNTSIKQIYDLAHDAGLSKVDIVCTRSEEIQTSEAIDEYPAERVNIADMQRHIEEQKQKKKSLKPQISEYYQYIADLTAEEQEGLRTLNGEYHKAESAIESHDLELKRLIIGLRNEKVSCGLREAYGSSPNATSPGVFCVSNKLYRDNRENPASIAFPFLELSGILELRRYCIGLVAQSRLQATQTFIKDHLPALIGSVELWTEAGFGNASAESKQRVLAVVISIQQKLEKVRSSWSPVR